MLNEVKYNKRQLYLLQYWPLLFFAYDFAAKILINFNITKIYLYAIVFKASVLIYSYSSFYLNNYKYHLKKNSFIKWTLLLILFFVIGHLTFVKHLTKDSINYSLYYLLNSVIPILLVPVYLSSKVLLKKTIRIFLIVLSINFLFIIIGFSLEVETFRSYFRTEGRFGYSGFLLYHWESGYLYFSAAYIAQVSYVSTKKYIYLCCFLLSMTALLFLGTKKGLFLAVLYIIYLIILKRATLIKQYRLVLFVLLISLGIAKPIFNNIFKHNWNFFHQLYNDKGFLNAFFSYRMSILTENLQSVLLDKWNVLNYIFGGALFSQLKSELELIDLVMCFGFLGVIIYFKLIKRIIVNKEIGVLTFLLILAAFFAGNFFSSINVVSFYLLIVCFLDKNNNIKIYS